MMPSGARIGFEFLFQRGGEAYHARFAELGSVEAASKRIVRAQAMRLSMRALIKQGGFSAHPRTTTRLRSCPYLRVSEFLSGCRKQVLREVTADSIELELGLTE